MSKQVQEKTKDKEKDKTEKKLPLMYQELKISPKQKTIVIMRGIPGCGKSTLAHALEKEFADMKLVAKICSADDYFMMNGKYLFNRNDIKVAHTTCLTSFTLAIANKKVQLVIVDNTNAKQWEYDPYIKQNQKMNKGFTIKIIQFGSEAEYADPKVVEKVYVRNKHDVPWETVKNMVSNWQFNSLDHVLPFSST